MSKQELELPTNPLNYDTDAVFKNYVVSFFCENMQQLSVWNKVDGSFCLLLYISTWPV